MKADDVTLAIGVGKRLRSHAVVMRFDDEDAPMVLTPEQAEKIAAQLISCAHSARQRNGAGRSAS